MGVSTSVSQPLRPQKSNHAESSWPSEPCPNPGLWGTIREPQLGCPKPSICHGLCKLPNSFYLLFSLLTLLEKSRAEVKLTPRRATVTTDLLSGAKTLLCWTLGPRHLASIPAPGSLGVQTNVCIDKCGGFFVVDIVDIIHIPLNPFFSSVQFSDVTLCHHHRYLTQGHCHQSKKQPHTHFLRPLTPHGSSLPTQQLWNSEPWN